MQFIDCSILDVQTLQFAPKILVCSFMYLVLGTFLFILREKLQGVVAKEDCGRVSQKFALLSPGIRNERIQ